MVPYVSQPGAPADTRVPFVTQAGSPGLVPVSENPSQGTRISAAAIESDVERAEAQRKADLKRR